MAIELLYWPGCPSHEKALAELQAALAECARTEATIEVREVRSEEEAIVERFIGSPTIRIDGVDVVEPPADEPYGLTCRVYHRRDGRVSPTPDPEDLREALRASSAHSHARA